MLRAPCCGFYELGITMNEEVELELTKLRTNFYCINYRRMVGVLLLMLVINIALTGVVFYHIASRPGHEYFATSQNGNLTQIYALSDPIMSPQDVLVWTRNVATIAYTFNFVNYNDVLQQLQKYFTPEGLVAFTKNFLDAKNLDPITSKKIVVSSAINGTPVILEQGVTKGKYVWKIQVPMLITYQSPVDTTQQPIILSILVTRTSTQDIAIADLTAINVPIPGAK